MGKKGRKKENLLTSKSTINKLYMSIILQYSLNILYYKIINNLFKNYYI